MKKALSPGRKEKRKGLRSPQEKVSWQSPVPGGTPAGLPQRRDPALSRQGLLAGVWCLNEIEKLSPGQSDEIDRVRRCYPHLTDDEFVRAHLDEWLAV